MNALGVDVFISFKDGDSGDPGNDHLLARDLYDELNAHGVRAFFSPEAFTEHATSDYVGAIEEALDEASLLIVVGSSTDNLNSKWVRYEWQSFLNEILSGTKPSGSIFSLTAGLTPAQLPRPLRQFSNFPATRLVEFARMVAQEVPSRGSPRDSTGAASTPIPSRSPAAQQPGRSIKYTEFLKAPRDLDDVARAYASRSAAAENVGMFELLKAADTVRLAGISLNFICQQVSAPAVLKVLAKGTNICALFLDPDSTAMLQREHEEQHAPGTLATLTRINIAHLGGVRKLARSRGLAGALEIGLTGETPRFNMSIFDEDLCVVQPYMPVLRGVDSPTLVLARRSDQGLTQAFLDSFDGLWASRTQIG